MKNKTQLITYIDRLSGGNINLLNELLTSDFSGLFSGVHLLPFYYPIDGSDAGFDPIDHSMVDSRLGNWEDIKHLGREFELMADLIVNHMSADSAEFRDVLTKGRSSDYWDLFLTKQTVFPEGLNEQQQQMIYRPRPGSCFTVYELATGEKVEFWTTFTRNQIDINVESAAGKAYLTKILRKFAESNIKIIRLDAAGYAIKRAGTRCFMLTETFDFITSLAKQAENLGIKTLVEIHSHHKAQIEIAKRVDLVYDFALPPLVLHSLFSRDPAALVSWLAQSPRNCINVLDTHDGIGIIDVGPMEDNPGLLTSTQIDALVETIHKNTRGESLKATGDAAQNVDLYQVNSSYFSALGCSPDAYLLARAIQFFSPGIPQVYYGGLLAEKNDMELLTKSNVGRDINRPYLDVKRIQRSQNKSVVKGLKKLIKFRNDCEAFNGVFDVKYEKNTFEMSWHNEVDIAKLSVDLFDYSFSIMYSCDGCEKTFKSEDIF